MNTLPGLIIVNGPIASGKSTLAQAMGKQLRFRGHSAAVIDLDLLYDMIDHRPKSDPVVWGTARRTAAFLAELFWSNHIDVVIVEGSFWDEDERAELLSQIKIEVHLHVLTLLVPFEEALRRAQGDPTRGTSRDPVFLAQTHATFLNRTKVSQLQDHFVDTQGTDPQSLAAELVDAFLVHPTGLTFVTGNQ